ncbi:hypothetical protein Bca4012_039807 [Brassica carinata]|uniref:Uncharacterized protein n=1 Tax=Brassica carinata TaxID=52824 RepID=A0A8X8B8G6_BRACI|nr:hypothetical protein Bca52824_008041 [Brassica carinata]
MATWLWLEDFGFEQIFSVIMALDDPFIADLANEAVLCFRCLESKDAPNDFCQIPVTAELMDISLQIIYQNRYTAIAGIKNFLTTVCSRIFSDIIQQVLPPSYIHSHNQPLIIPGFPHPTFGSINVMPSVASLNNVSNINLFHIPSGIWGWNASCTATEIDRTLFLTFSRGYPVSEAEVKLLFTEKYGENSVKGVHMPNYSGNLPNQNLNSNGKQQSLYARMVVDSVVTVDRILMGKSKQKFTKDGKHIWARKFEDRYRK